MSSSKDFLKINCLEHVKEIDQINQADHYRKIKVKRES